MAGGGIRQGFCDRLQQLSFSSTARKVLFRSDRGLSWRVNTGVCEGEGGCSVIVSGMA